MPRPSTGPRVVRESRTGLPCPPGPHTFSYPRARTSRGPSNLARAVEAPEGTVSPKTSSSGEQTGVTAGTGVPGRVRTRRSVRIGPVSSPTRGRLSPHRKGLVVHSSFPGVGFDSGSPSVLQGCVGHLRGSVEGQWLNGMNKTSLSH